MKQETTVETTRLLSEVNRFWKSWLYEINEEEADEKVHQFCIELREMCGDYSDTEGN
jgi:hypothetical protein